MAHRAMKTAQGQNGVQFPPEADGDFEVVKREEILAWREKLNERFGIGQGKLKSLDVVPAR
ncbi:hypothetical protein [Pseudooceanicola nanhaiensis]|uniref:hypothetical protein n=1 Tax=Pseudooceanicola nanhaiensis TaxID=375761 RepID=UPI003517632B